MNQIFAAGNDDKSRVSGSTGGQDTEDLAIHSHDVSPSGAAPSSGADPVHPHDGLSAEPRSPFSLLTHLAGDADQIRIFSDESAIESWLAVERALAQAQGEHGVIDKEDASAIMRAARRENISKDNLWESTRNVGYPILGIVREISAALPEGANGRVHFGATTQDIMDSGLALQLVRSLESLDQRLQRLGTALAMRVEEHACTVMPGRTHAQQAVPTTFGATLSTLLSQVSRQRERLIQSSTRIGVISMFGAGGTSAAYGPKSAEVRARVAELLGLANTDVPWHVDRDGLAEFGWLCATITATCAKLARNIIDLSRTEIGEVFEPYASHRGASSTMPQKVNPISSEIIIGLAGTAGALASALTRIQEAGHERSAGEWQIEWHVIPQLAVLAGSALNEAATIAEGMRVDPKRMQSNLELDGGLVMAEAQMIQLAGSLGRENAHDLVYEAATLARLDGSTLEEALRRVAKDNGTLHLLPRKLVSFSEYLGEAQAICRTAIRQWRQTTALNVALADQQPLSELATRPSS